MTQKDLEILYLQEHGEEVPCIDAILDEDQIQGVTEKQVMKLKDYIAWLENKLIALYRLP